MRTRGRNRGVVRPVDFVRDEAILHEEMEAAGVAGRPFEWSSIPKANHFVRLHYCACSGRSFADILHRSSGTTQSSSSDFSRNGFEAMSPGDAHLPRYEKASHNRRHTYATLQNEVMYNENPNTRLGRHYPTSLRAEFVLEKAGAPAGIERWPT